MAMPWAASGLPLRGGNTPVIVEMWYQLATEVSGGLLSSAESLKSAEGGLNKGLWALGGRDIIF